MSLDADSLAGVAPGRGWSMGDLLAGVVQRLFRLIGLGVPVVLPPDVASRRGTGWLATTTLLTAVSLLAVSVSMTAARAGADWAPSLYWTAVTVIVALPSLRICSRHAATVERFWLVMLLGQALLAVKVLRAPDGFINFDELLHVSTANSILEQGRLFELNTLLPISAFFPGLEIVTAALVKLSGVGIFAAGNILVAAARAVFQAALFLLVERTTRSGRVAGAASVVYVGSGNIAFFHAQYAYESLAFSMFVVAVFAERIDAARPQMSPLLTALLLGPFFIAITVTHHTTASFLAAMAIIVAALELTRSVPRAVKLRAVALAVPAIATIIVWSRMTGDPTAGYIGPLVSQGLDELFRFLTGQSAARRLFVSDDGVEQALLRRVVSLGSVLLVLAGLTVGFLRTMTLAGGGGRPRPFLAMLGDLWRWRDSRLVALVLLTLLFPVSLALRLTTSGWELGSRLAAVSYIGVCVAVAVALVSHAPGRRDSALRGVLASLVAIVIAMGGYIVGWGVVNLPTGYRVAGDAMSVEQAGIDAAHWTRYWLGEGNRFGADRTNRLLLATYGRQEIVTTLLHHVDMSRTTFNQTVTASELYDIRSGRVDFMLLDMRMELEKPLMGVYFEKGEPAWVSAKPPTYQALSKFNDIPGISRVYDSGAIKIVDVRILRNAVQIP